MSEKSILIRAGKDPHTVLSAEMALAYHRDAAFGNNIGNMLYFDAVWRLLSVPEAHLTADTLTPERKPNPAWASIINERFDHYVVPMANAFRKGAGPWLDHISSTIKNLRIPATLVGVGANISDEGERYFEEETEEAVVRFVKAFLDHSPSIGVRGEITAAYLKSLGFGDEHVTIIGCPSVYLNGPDYAVTKRVDHIDEHSPIALSVAPTESFFAKVVVRHTQAYPNMIYIPQEDKDLAMMMWGVDRSDQIFAEGMPVTPSHPLFSQDRMRFPLDSRTWIDLLRPMHVAFGTRIHGMVAALLAGVPAIAVPFGSRILELAQYHDIPYVPANEVREDFDIARAYESSDWTAFNTGLAPRFAVLTHFLEENDLSHIYQDGQANPAFDQEISSITYPSAVHALTPQSPSFTPDLLTRVSWLWRMAPKGLPRDLKDSAPSELENALQTIDSQKPRLWKYLTRILAKIRKFLK